MHLYSIMPIDMVDEHLEEIAKDIKYQYENGIATTALMMMTLVPEGNPPIDKAGIYLKAYDKIRDRLKKEGKENSIKSKKPQIQVKPIFASSKSWCR